MPSPGPLRDAAWRLAQGLTAFFDATYLWHMPVLNATERWGPGPEHAAAQVSVVYGVSIVLGWLTTKFVGDPAIAYADTLSRQNRSATGPADPD